MNTKRDWHSEPIDSDTIIDDAHKNTQNVRRFFKRKIGTDFKFDRTFMAWMKSNIGKSMGDAVLEFKKQKNLS